MIQMDVFNSLAQKYIQVPLIFPIQIVEPKDYSRSLGTDTNVDTAMTAAVKHCDAAFTLFRTDMHSKSCFINPCISYIFNIDGKYYPRESCDTFNDKKSINLTFDALNVNNSLLSSVSEDLRSSLQPFTPTKMYTLSAVEGHVGEVITTDRNVFTSGDRSNFMIGIPFCDSNDFMGGISTKSTVQIQLTGERKGYDEIKALNLAQPVTVFFQDAFLKIRAIKPSGRPQIEITKCSIEEIIASGGR